jgi:tetratricopeptide (TPR) repeat protein
MAQTTLAEEWLGKGLVLFESQEYEKAIMAYEQAIRIVPQLAEAWAKKGEALRALDRHE